MTNKARLAKPKLTKPRSKAKILRKSTHTPPEENIKGGEKTVEFNDEIGPLSLVDYLWRNRVD